VRGRLWFGVFPGGSIGSQSAMLVGRCPGGGRFAAAAGSFFSAILTKEVFSGYLPPLPYRYSAMTMCAIFLVGIVAVAFAPETKGQPLPEDDEGAR
jgi:hypothetical protein